MLFNSYVFILFFLPVCIIGYYSLNSRRNDIGQLFLFLMSLWFYAYFNIRYLKIILISIVANYGIYFIFQKISGKNVRKIILGMGLGFDLGVLIYFKYMDFFIMNINKIFHMEHQLWGVLLPLGISFFTFQQISFIVDAYRGEVPKYNLLYYASFVTFFRSWSLDLLSHMMNWLPSFWMKSGKKLIGIIWQRGFIFLFLAFQRKFYWQIRLVIV